MSKGYVVKKHIMEKNRNLKEKERFSPSKHLKRIYPFPLHTRNYSSCSFSSFSLTLSNSSNDSSITDSVSSFTTKFLLPMRRLSMPPEKNVQQQQQPSCPLTSSDEELKRCNWITKNSDKGYVQFHDECWGVPVYEDNQLFELLAMSGMLMDYNWTEIVRRRDLLRESFAGFDPNIVAKMGEKEIMEVASNKELMLVESRVRCIVDNADCILKIVKECGSFSSYMWGSVNYKPTINRYKQPRNVPIRTPKAEAMSKDLLKRGFRLVGPVIVCSFMQAAGMTIDHLVDCFRFNECVSLAERPWRHV